MPEVQFPSPQDINDFLAESDEEYKWLIPGLLEFGDRVILTGNEGRGKSTLMRQFAVQIASGISPFSLDSIEPRRVLFIDLENPKRLLRRKLKDIQNISVPRDRLLVQGWPGGLDLTQVSHQQVLLDIFVSFFPDLVIIGPMYKMAPNLETEAGSALLSSLLDQWRTVFDFGVIMESHQPHAVVTKEKNFRPERPFGSSLWLRWPEFGLCLEDDGRLRHWRGPRDIREWPDKLRWGDQWPWMIDRRICLVCENELSDKQQKYCSRRCADAAHKRDQRSQERLL